MFQTCIRSVLYSLVIYVMLYLSTPIFIFTLLSSVFFFFFLNDPATPEISTLPLHDALPISRAGPPSSLTRVKTQSRTVVDSTLRARQSEAQPARLVGTARVELAISCAQGRRSRVRSEEHTSELQSHLNLVCRLLLEKKKK